MNYIQKRQQLVEEYNRNQEAIQRLSTRNQRILGQLELIGEILKEEEAKKAKKPKK